MKKLAALFCLFAATLSADEKFWESLTPEQRATAGVESLTKAQRAALNELARRYVAGQAEHQVTQARARAVAEVREQVKAEVRQEVRQEVQAEVKAEEAKKVGFERTAAPDDAIRTRIAGTFRGWGKGTVFRLENGQVWAVDGGTVEARFFTRRENPEVELRPSSFGTWKLFVQPEGLWVRVKRVQ